MRFQSLSLEVEIETPESDISKVWYKESIIYYGHDVIRWHSFITRNRSFFPQRRPRFRKSDLKSMPEN